MDREDCHIEHPQNKVNKVMYQSLTLVIYTQIYICCPNLSNLIVYYAGYSCFVCFIKLEMDHIIILYATKCMNILENIFYIHNPAYPN